MDRWEGRGVGRGGRSGTWALCGWHPNAVGLHVLSGCPQVYFFNTLTQVRG